MNRVLIVDDKPENLYLLRMLLQGHGHTVAEARNGRVALDLARQEPPDLVISDLLMPEMDGYTLLNAWKADPRLQVVPFIVYTATYTDAQDEQAARDMGADAFLIKPTEPAEFIRQLNGVLERAQRGEQTLPKLPQQAAEVRLRSYSEALVRKLEQRTEELQRTVAELRTAQSRMRLSARALGASATGVMITERSGPEGRIIYVNPAFERITGYSADELLGQPPRVLLSDTTDPDTLAALRTALQEEREARTMLRSQRKDGSIFWSELTVAPVPAEDGQPGHFIGVLDDITARKHFQDELARQANFDALTGLANRNLLADRVAVTIAYAGHAQRVMALLFIDLDQFKRINDSLGHALGDAVLRETARRITACLRDRDTAARLGGDEFVVVLADLARAADASLVAAKILAAIAAPMSIEGHTLTVSASIGASVYPDDGNTQAALLRNADSAMYRAKEAGRDCFRFYTVDMNAGAGERLDLEMRLRRAIADEEMVLHYQPIFDSGNGQLKGLEALLRWRAADGTLIPPGDFIPLAEDTGLIMSLGTWALREACRQMRRWADIGLEHFRVSVNLSARQLRERELPMRIEALLEDYRLSGQRLQVEITESSMMHSATESAAILTDLARMGVGVSVDDFGTGYFSLAHLRHFPLNELKIDRAFVQAAPQHPEDATIVRALVDLARNLRLTTVAEGVETEAQREFVISSGCSRIQGFLLGKPVPAADIEPLLRAGRQDMAPQSNSA